MAAEHFSPVRNPKSDDPKPRFVNESEREFAGILDFYRIKWDYEPFSFPLRWEDDRILEMFTPDFYLLEQGLYIELTTMRQSLVTRKNRKMRQLRDLYPEINIVLLYARDYHQLLANYGYTGLEMANLPEENIERILFSPREIQSRVVELGAEVSRDYAGRSVLLVGILKGVAIFMADLARQISVPVAMDFLAVSSYGRSSASSGVVRLIKDLDESIEGVDVLLVEDIVNTGLTLNYILKSLRARRPASLTVCTMLNKRDRRLAEVKLDYVGFEAPSEFVVGYGLDYQERYRNLPFICVLKPQVYRESAPGTEA